MSIEEIKNIRKLKEMLISEITENKRLKEHCENAGKELAKYSFDYDYKPKNLVIQAYAVNKKLDELIKRFVDIYIERKACEGCPYKPKMGMCENYEDCFERMKEIIGYEEKEIV